MTDIKLTTEIIEEYAKFIKTIFRRANEENSLKKKVYTLIEEYLDNEENRQNLTLGSLIKLLQEVNKSDNEFIVGILNALSKKAGENSNNFFIPSQSGKFEEKEIKNNQSNSNDVIIAKRLLQAFNEMKNTLEKSEK